MAFLLRQVLRRLCLEAGLSYAVFWRAAHGGDQTLLECGDGHCEPMIDAADRHVLDHVCQAQERVTTLVIRIMVSQVLVTGHGCVSSLLFTQDNSTLCPLEALEFELIYPTLPLSYELPSMCTLNLRNRIIGTAALAGTYESLFHHEFNDYGFASKVLDELNQNCSAGILTVTIVPVLTHGVVQFGSTKEVIKDIAFITNVRNLFTQLGCGPGFSLFDLAYSPFNEIFVIPSFSTMQSGYVCCNQLHDQNYHSSLESVTQDYSSPILQTYGNSQADSCFRAYKHNQNDDAGPRTVQDYSSPILQTYGNSQADSCFRAYKHNQNDDAGPRTVQALNEGNMSGSIQTAFRNEMLCKLVCQDKSGIFHCCLDVIISKCDLVINTGELGTDAFAYINHSSGCAIVDSFSNVISCNGTSVDTNIFKISSGLKGNADETTSSESSLTTAVQWPDESFDVSNPLKEVAGLAISACILDRVEEYYARKTKHLVCKSQLSTWFGNGAKLQSDSISAKQSDKACEGGKLIGRLKPSKNSRHRPKDRELIQDRLGELREIVPYGEKCSVETLLEKTIKHTLFLQNVLTHAEILKKSGKAKSTKEGGLLLKANSEVGATWAFEISNKFLTCPIVVHNINPHRLMILEMVCEEQGYLQEIADFTRGLGLTILKSAMETRNAKVWAYFAIKAKRDMTRMEIFMSLLRCWKHLGKAAKHQNVMKNDHDI